MSIMNIANGYTNPVLPASKTGVTENTAHAAVKDITLNVSLKEAMERAIIALISPVIICLFYKYSIIFITPVITYLYLTAMMRYCVVKYLWRRYVSHHALIKRAAYGMDVNYPEESLPAIISV